MSPKSRQSGHRCQERALLAKLLLLLLLLLSINVWPLEVPVNRATPANKPGIEANVEMNGSIRPLS
jgi:hypothetical protein